MSVLPTKAFSISTRPTCSVVPFTTLGTPVQLIKAFGDRRGFKRAVREMQNTLYQERACP